MKVGNNILLVNHSPEFKIISSNNIPAPIAPYLTWAILFICLGYQYKLIFCGFLGQVLGFKSICYTFIHGISTNHWLEHLLYVPLMWVALNHVNNIVFGPHTMEVLSKRQQQKKWLGQLLCALFIYGHGIHAINLLEMMARAEGVASGIIYEQIWWLDEQVSHGVQFITFFLLLCFFISQDRLDRNHGKTIAIVTGIIHGIDRGVGVIEGDHPYLGVFAAMIISVACYYRWQKHGRNFKRVWKDFFFLHGLGFVITILVLLVCYQLLFGLYTQPSTMGLEAWKVVVLAIFIIFVELLIIFGLDKKLNK